MADGVEPASTSAGYETQELAEEIVRILRKEKIHPVLVLGTRSSGKTMMLASLFSYATSHDRVRIYASRGETIWPRDHPSYAQVEESGRQILEIDVIAIGDGDRPPPTNREAPFFVPINIERDGHTQRFAFLEGMGEWFQREVRKGVPEDRTRKLREMEPFRPLKTIVSHVLRTYENGISVIFVTPCVDGHHGEPMKYAHECMANAITEVEKHRRQGDKSRDNLLLLVSKWDAACPPGQANSHFSDASADIVSDRVGQWGAVWSRFVAVTGYSENAKALMPYSSAWVQSDQTIRKSGEHGPVFNRFNRTLLNWLYGNASTAFPDKVGKRVVLYPDVMPPIPQKMSTYERIARFVAADQAKPRS